MPSNSGADCVGWMQSTGQTSTHSPDLTLMQGSAITKAIGSTPSESGFSSSAGKGRFLGAPGLPIWGEGAFRSNKRVGRRDVGQGAKPPARGLDGGCGGLTPFGPQGGYPLAL